MTDTPIAKAKQYLSTVLEVHCPEIPITVKKKLVEEITLSICNYFCGKSELNEDLDKILSRNVLTQDVYQLIASSTFIATGMIASSILEEIRSKLGDNYRV